METRKCVGRETDAPREISTREAAQVGNLTTICGSMPWRRAKGWGKGSGERQIHRERSPPRERQHKWALQQSWRLLRWRRGKLSGVELNVELLAGPLSVAVSDTLTAAIYFSLVSIVSILSLSAPLSFPTNSL